MELEMEAEKLAALLREWQATPFFETRAEWERWRNDFGTRVAAALEESDGR